MAISLSDNITLPENSIPPIVDIEIADLIDLELLSKLDSIKSNGNLYKRYSEIYSGGVYALNAKNRTENSDWMSQSANSFREIFYVLKKNEAKDLKSVLEDYLKKTITKKEIEKYKRFLESLYNLFTDLTHHFSSVANLAEQVYQVNENLFIKASELDQGDYSNYFKAVRLYKEYLKLMVITAFETHQKIDKCIKDNKKDKEQVRMFLNNSVDSNIYFFSKTDENWLHWLWTKGFLVALKEPAKDPTKYSYRMPELEYLTRMAEKDITKFI